MNITEYITLMKPCFHQIDAKLQKVHDVSNMVSLTEISGH